MPPSRRNLTRCASALFRAHRQRAAYLLCRVLDGTANCADHHLADIIYRHWQAGQ